MRVLRARRPRWHQQLRSSQSPRSSHAQPQQLARSLRVSAQSSSRRPPQRQSSRPRPSPPPPRASQAARAQPCVGARSPTCCVPPWSLPTSSAASASSTRARSRHTRRTRACACASATGAAPRRYARGEVPPCRVHTTRARYVCVWARAGVLGYVARVHLALLDLRYLCARAPLAFHAGRRSPAQSPPPEPGSPADRPPVPVERVGEGVLDRRVRRRRVALGGRARAGAPAGQGCAQSQQRQGCSCSPCRHRSCAREG
jgi:hypothetical protein